MNKPITDAHMCFLLRMLLVEPSRVPHVGVRGIAVESSLASVLRAYDVFQQLA
jgi:hypothetical protein